MTDALFMSWLSPMLLLAGDSIAYSKMSATLSATACKHFTTVGGRHAFTESMLIYSFSVRGLKRSVHRCYNVLFVVKAYKASAKLHKTFD